MTRGSTPGGFEFRFGDGKGQMDMRMSPRRGEDVMRILVMGDFSGRADRNADSSSNHIAGREAVEVDASTIDEAMARMGVAVMDPLASKEDALPIEFRSLEDFHPDRLVKRVEAFGKLRSIRDRLRNAGKSEAAAAELVGLLGFDPGAMAGAAAPVKSGGGEFASLLSETPTWEETARAGEFDVDSFIRAIVQPHVVRGGDAGREEAYLGAADAAISALMRRVLHSGAVKELEALWRGVHRLVANVETGEKVTVHLLDVSRDEVIGDLATSARSGGGSVSSGIYAQVVEGRGRMAGEGGWGLVVCGFGFQRTVQDAVLLSALAEIAALGGAVLMAGAGPSLVGCRSFADHADPSGWTLVEDGAGQAWRMVRSTEAARHVVLGMPRTLLRVPYGAGGEPAESFVFEELPGVTEPGMNASEDRARHEAYVWGSSALVIAEAMARTFVEEGWTMDPNVVADVGGMPVHSFPEGPGGAGPKRVMPCAETWMSERGAYAVREVGVTPVMSIKGTDAVRVAGVVSLHQSGDAPAGRWR